MSKDLPRSLFADAYKNDIQVYVIALVSNITCGYVLEVHAHMHVHNVFTLCYVIALTTYLTGSKGIGGGESKSPVPVTATDLP